MGATHSSRYAIEIVPGSIYALGSSIPIDEHVSWMPTGRVGFMRLNSYLLVDDERNLLIDTGAQIHRAELLSQMVAVLGEGAEVSVFLTRVEGDCIGNLEALGDRFLLREVLGGGRLNPFDFFEDLNSIGGDRDAPELELSRKSNGETVRLSPSREVEVIQTPLRLLATFWLFDHGTGTLFTSDSFSHGIGESPDSESPIIEAVSSAPGEVAAFLSAKFDWLEGADSSSIRSDLRAMFDRLDVKNIAPGHGRAFLGRDVVSDEFDSMVKALEMLQALGPERPAG